MIWDGPTIDVTADAGLSHAVIRSTLQGATYATLVFKATFELVPDGPARRVEAEPVAFSSVHRSGDRESSLVVASEIAPFLSRAAILLTGSAFPPPRGAAPPPPRSTPTSGEPPFTVRFAVSGPTGSLVDKSLRIEPSGPGPTPLTYEDALVTDDNPAGSRWPLVVHPSRPEEAAGFGPISPLWPPRARLLHGARAPELQGGVLDLGAGLDARFFNPAPEDQQAPFLQGSETITVEGLDPVHPRVVTRLPRARVVARQRSRTTPSPARVELALDMMVVDAHRRRVSLVWRALQLAPPHAGRVTVEAALHTEAERVAVPPPPILQSQPIPSPPTLQSPIVSPAIVPPAIVPPAIVPPAIVPAAIVPPAIVPPAIVPPDIIQSPIVQSESWMVERTVDAAADTGHPKALPFPESPAAPRETGAAIPATPYDAAFDPITVATASDALIETVDQRPAPSPAVPPAIVTLEVEPTVAASPEDAPAAPFLSPPAPIDPEPSEAPPATPEPPAEPPMDDRGDPRRASLLARLKEGAAPRDMDLADADLSDLDLTGWSFSGSRLDGADLSRSKLAGANLAEVSLKSAKLHDAILTGANLARADLSKAHATGADFTHAILTCAILSQLDAPKATFTGADLSGANAERALLDDAILDEIAGKGGTFEKASLRRARLARAHLAGARFSKASLDEASFVDADLSGADLSKCTGPQAHLMGARLEGANLKQSTFTDADFSRASLGRASLARGVFTRARFEGADLSGVDGRDARLASARLTRANLTFADLRDADLSSTEMTDAVLIDTKLRGAKR